MKRLFAVLSMVFCLCVLTACGNSKGTPEPSVMPEAAQEEVVIEAEDRVDDTSPVSAEPVAVKDLAIPLPDSTWSSKYDRFFDSWMLYKEGCYDSLNSSLELFIIGLSPEDAVLGSMNVSDGIAEAEFKELDYEINGVTCPAYEQYMPSYDKSVVKAFFPISSNRTLRINIFVRKGSVQGVDPYSDEVKQLLQRIVEKNGFPADASETEGQSPETIELTEEGLSPTGKTYEGDTFSVAVPDGWEVFTSEYGRTSLIKGGTDSSDFGEKPSVSVYHKEKNAHTSYVTDKTYYPDAVDLTVRICGTDYAAIRTNEASGSTYWNYVTIFLEISDSESLSVKICTESSKFDAVSLTDDDVREILVSLRQSASN